eukprot:scaffold8567_cov277-Pinguiococcus_pyrenoidosus.AAC.1
MANGFGRMPRKAGCPHILSDPCQGPRGDRPCAATLQWLHRTSAGNLAAEGVSATVQVQLLERLSRSRHTLRSPRCASSPLSFSSLTMASWQVRGLQAYPRVSQLRSGITACAADRLARRPTERSLSSEKEIPSVASCKRSLAEAFEDAQRRREAATRGGKSASQVAVAPP